MSKNDEGIHAEKCHFAERRGEEKKREMIPLFKLPFLVMFFSHDEQESMKYVKDKMKYVKDTMKYYIGMSEDLSMMKGGEGIW